MIRQGLSRWLNFTGRWILAIACCASVGKLQAAVVATDYFNRPNGSLGSNWVAPIASEANLIVTNGAVGVDLETNHCYANWSADGFNDDQYSQARITSLGPWTGVILRADAVQDRFYIGFVFGPNDYRIYARWDGSYYELAGGSAETWHVGDTLKLEASGSANPMTVTMCRNGKPVLMWRSTVSIQVRTGGSPGLGIYSQAGQHLTLDHWEGGNMDQDAQPPTVPADPTANAVSLSQINLSWMPSADDSGVAGYLVERSEGAGSTNYRLLGTPTVTNFTDTTAFGNTTYSYRVRSTDAAGNLSGYSEVVTATTPIPDPPTISVIPDQSTLIGISVGPFPFYISDPGVKPTTLTAIGKSSNPALVPDQNIQIFNLGFTQALTVTPVDGQSGTSVITVTVGNGLNSNSTSFLLTVNPPANGTDVFANPSNIVIRSFGAATLYPSTIPILGMAGMVTNLKVTLHGMSHPYPSDVNVLLVGPNGQSVVLMSDTVGDYPMTNLTFTLSDDAFYPLPASSPMLPGTFQPTDYAPNHTNPAYAFPPSAPPPPYSTDLEAFNGRSPNGTWSLYVYDGGAGDSGQISGGWSLAITAVSAPTIHGLTTNQSTPVNTPTGALPFDIEDGQTAASNLVLTATSSDPSVINAATDIAFGGSDTNRTLTLSPEPNTTGTTTVSVIVTDSDGMSATNSFLMTVSRGQLTVTGITASNKTYDGTSGVTLNTDGYALAGQGLLASPLPDVSLSASALTAQFSDPNAANSKTVTVSGLTLSGANSANYILTQPTLTADIARAALTVTADDASRAYGHTNPLFTVGYNGFVNSEGSGVLGGTLLVSSPTDTSSPTGTYPLLASGLTSTNYLITYIPGILTVNPAQLSIALASSLDPSLLGRSVTFTATAAPISQESITPAGVVQFYFNGAAFGDPVLLNGGTATLTTALLPQGSNTVTAVFVRDSNFLASTNDLVQTITVGTPTTLNLEDNGDGTVTATFEGTPAGHYVIQATDAPGSMPWSNISTNIAGPDGLWTFSESRTNHVQRFFRSKIL